MKDNHPKYFLLSILLFTIIILILWIIRPPSSYDQSNIDRRLTSLEEPFKAVETKYCQDGGSIFITIVDKNDTLLNIALPNSDFDGSYEQIYFGVESLSDLEKGGVEIENPVETKLMLEDILERYSDTNPYLYLTLCSMRGRAMDYVNVTYHSKMGHYDKPGFPK